MLCWKQYKTGGFGIFWKKEIGEKNVTKVESNLVQGWVKAWSKHVAQHHKWTKFWLKNANFCLIFLFLKNLILPTERRCLKSKQGRNEENLDQCLSQKRPFLDPSFGSTAHIYIYIERESSYPVQVWPFRDLLSGPRLSFSKIVCQAHDKIGVSAHFV